MPTFPIATATSAVIYGVPLSIVLTIHFVQNGREGGELGHPKALCECDCISTLHKHLSGMSVDIFLQETKLQMPKYTWVTKSGMISYIWLFTK